MNKEKLLALGLSEEQVNKVLEVFGGYVPKERFDEVNEAKKKALETINERDKQLDDLNKSKGDLDVLKSEIAKLQETNSLAKEQYEKDLNTLKINNAVELALTTAGARNTKSVKALLDLNDATFDGETVNGLAEQIATLKSGENSFLFRTEEKANTNNAPVGMKQTEGNTSVTNKLTNEMNYTDWCNYLNDQNN